MAYELKESIGGLGGRKKKGEWYNYINPKNIKT